MFSVLSKFILTSKINFNHNLLFKKHFLYFSYVNCPMWMAGDVTLNKIESPTSEFPSRASLLSSANRMETADCRGEAC